MLVELLAGAAVAFAGGPEAAVDPPALSTAQLAGQRIVEAMPGRTPPKALLARIRRGEVAGVILFSRNIGSKPQVRALVGRLQREPRPAAADAPLLVLVDQEGGLVKRLPGAPSRSPAAIGRSGSASLARRTGSATAGNLRSHLINVNLAPVLDVGRPGSFQRHTGRSYSGNSATVSRLGSAFAGGLEHGGVASALKHFPGLGTIRRDEDAVVQRVSTSLGKLRRVDEPPFAAGIKAGARLVMTSTALYPALDGRRPALLSRAIVTGELRGRLAFEGVIVTDDLDVPALRPYGKAGTLAVAAAGAGNDLLLFCGGGGSGPAGRGALARAIASGRVGRADAVAAATRVLALRESLR